MILTPRNNQVDVERSRSGDRLFNSRNLGRPRHRGRTVVE